MRELVADTGMGLAAVVCIRGCIAIVKDCRAALNRARAHRAARARIAAYSPTSPLIPRRKV
jgi:hypothetical protein